MEEEHAAQGEHKTRGDHHADHIVRIGSVELLEAYVHAMCHEAEGCDQTAESRMEDEVKKVLVVVEGHAVADPGTVMVHSEHATTADGAMVGARRPH